MHNHFFSKVKTTVLNNSPSEQVPQYGVIHQTGDEGCDFVFPKQ
jgi:hypothetical protein